MVKQEIHVKVFLIKRIDMEIITKIKKYQNREWLYLKPIGELDMSSAEQFKKTIINGLEKSGCRMLYFDFEKISFIDSSGLGVLLGRYRELVPIGGKIIITHANAQVYRLLYASGLHRIMEIDKPTSGKYVKEGI